MSVARRTREADAIGAASRYSSVVMPLMHPEHAEVISSANPGRISGSPSPSAKIGTDTTKADRQPRQQLRDHLPRGSAHQSSAPALGFRRGLLAGDGCRWARLLRHPLPEPRLVEDEENVRRDERRDGRHESAAEEGPHRAVVEVKLGDYRLVLRGREYRAAAAPAADQIDVGVTHEGGDVRLVDVEDGADALCWECRFVCGGADVAACAVADE